MANTLPDKTQFLRLLEQHKSILHKVCHVYTNTAEDHRDLYQEIVLQLWRSFASFRGGAKYSTWIYRVSLNTAISLKRKHKPVELFLESKAISSEHSSNQTQTENQQLLQTLINSLNKVEKSLILLYLEEKSYEEISQIIGMTKTNVSVRLVRIKKKLADLYKTETI